MGEGALAALRMVDGTPGEISANGHANYHGTRECIIRAPANYGKLVANLHHRRPDVVEEPDLDDGLEPARGHSSGTADDRSLCQRRIENPVVAKFALQAEGQLEDSAFAL